MTPIPVGFRVALDPRTRELDRHTLSGGTPVRVLRLSPRGAEAWAELRTGTVRSRAGGLLARRVTDAGLGHPLPPPGATVEATVVVPVRDRADGLDRCLRGLGREYPVIVVDDASSDPIAVAAVARRHGATLLRREENGGPGAARNTGLTAATSDVVVFVDSDCAPAGAWITELAAHLADPLVAAAAPRIVAGPGEEPSVRYARWRGALDLGPHPAVVAPGTRVSYVPTAALVARRSALTAIARDGEVFDPALRCGEDVDLIWRLHHAGLRVRYDPHVTVAHAEPSTWRALLARRFRYGTSAAPLAGRHPGALAPLLVEPWTGAVLAALLLRRPGLAAGALAGALLDEGAARRRAGLRQEGTPAAVLGRTARTAVATGTYATQFLGPALATGLACPRTRVAAATLLLTPPLASWWSRRHGPPTLRGVTFLPAHVAEDVAYGAGVLRGCARHRTSAPLRPALVRRSRSPRPANVHVPRGGPPMSGEWFETVAEAQRRAKRRLPKSVYKALIAGSEQGLTLRDNRAAFNELGFAPHVAGGYAERELATTVMGQTISLPVVISPTGVQAVDPEGELPVARAAASRGTALGLSSFASRPIEDVAKAGAPTFFQVYWCGSHDVMAQRLERAHAAGAVGLILTLDWSFAHARDWGSPTIPQRIDLKAALKFAPEVLARPQWLAAFARSGSLPDLTVPNMAVGGQPAPGFFDAYGEWMQTPPPSWDDVAWLRARWPGPAMLKGIIRVDDARRAVDAGMSAISVSNHGGNNLDGTPAAIRSLPVIAEAVGHQLEVLLDGGIRRGGDVVKALALGARAVLIGRAYLWGLAANGQAGVENVLDILRNGIDSTLLALGHRSVHDLGRSDLVIPANFERRLGVAADTEI